MSHLNLPPANTKKSSGLGLELVVATLILVGMLGVFFWLQRAAPVAPAPATTSEDVKHESARDTSARPEAPKQ